MNGVDMAALKKCEITRDEREDPILADAYSLGIVILCMDLGDLIRIEARKQKKEE